MKWDPWKCGHSEYDDLDGDYWFYCNHPDKKDSTCDKDDCVLIKNEENA